MLRVGGSDLIEHKSVNELLHTSATIRVISTLRVIEEVEVISRLGFPFPEAECPEVRPFPHWHDVHTSDTAAGTSVCPTHAMLSSLGLPPLKRLLPYLVPLRLAVPTTTSLSIPIPILSLVDHEDSKER